MTRVAVAQGPRPFNLRAGNLGIEPQKLGSLPELWFLGQGVWFCVEIDRRDNSTHLLAHLSPLQQATILHDQRIADISFLRTLKNILQPIQWAPSAVAVSGTETTMTGK